jgi:hypothetical protein
MMVWQRTSNYGWWQRSYNGTYDNDKKTAIYKCAAAEVAEDDGWQKGWMNNNDAADKQRRSIVGGELSFLAIFFKKIKFS